MERRKYGAYPTHPGEILKDELEYRGISQRKLASQMGISYTAMNEILNAKRPVTTATAYLVEAALGVSAELLLSMQMHYNMHVAQQDKRLLSRLAAIRKISAVL